MTLDRLADHGARKRVFSTRCRAFLLRRGYRDPGEAPCIPLRSAPHPIVGEAKCPRATLGALHASCRPEMHENVFDTWQNGTSVPARP